MLNWLWFAITASSLVFAIVNGSANQALEACVGGAASAIRLFVNLCAGYLLFCGLLSILDALETPKRLERLLRPLLRVLMPSLQNEKAKRAVVANLAANLLGLGNAATPTGIQAMRLMEGESALRPRVRHDMRMLLILNATGIQLFPTTVLALRVAAGSAEPNRVIAPILACTAVSVAVGVGLGLVCRRADEGRQARAKK